MTENEVSNINDDGDRISEKTKRRILKKRLMQKMVIDNGN
jgi:hypothetical protein